jgi:hypothetical protein
MHQSAQRTIGLPLVAYFSESSTSIRRKLHLLLHNAISNQVYCPNLRTSSQAHISRQDCEPDNSKSTTTTKTKLRKETELMLPKTKARTTHLMTMLTPTRKMRTLLTAKCFFRMNKTLLKAVGSRLKRDSKSKRLVKSL